MEVRGREKKEKKEKDEEKKEEGVEEKKGRIRDKGRIITNEKQADYTHNIKKILL